MPATPQPEIPLATFRYTLEFADALAYERLRTRPRWTSRFAFAAWLALGVVVLAILPQSVTGPSSSLQFWGIGTLLILIQYGLYRIGRDLMRLRRASARVPDPIATELEQWPAHLVLTRNGAAQTILFSSIEALLPTPGHLFMAIPGDLVIVPARAFPGEEGIAGLADAIDTKVRETIDLAGSNA